LDNSPKLMKKESFGELSNRLIAKTHEMKEGAVDIG
jgi:hypothetical protein